MISGMLRLIVNGEAYELHGGNSFCALLREMGAHPDHVAVMLNGEVVPRERRESVVLKENDRIEVVSFCGGGAEKRVEK